MTHYRRKPTVVDAVQFSDAYAPPRGVRYDGMLFYVTTMQGVHVPVTIGEWIVQEADGLHFYPVADEEFQRIYEPVN